jgi:hypothetical protein
VTDLLSDNGDVMASLLRALCDPGQITDREPLESLTSWQRRAVIEFAAPYIMHAGALAEREAIIALAEQHQAWYVPECNPSECGPLCGTAAPFAYLIRKE